MPTMPPRFRPPGWAPPAKRADPFYTSKRWRELRAYVLKRDGGICQRCGRPGARLVHHVIERKDGGSDHPDNLEAVHTACHSAAHPTKGGRHD